MPGLISFAVVLECHATLWEPCVTSQRMVGKKNLHRLAPQRKKYIYINIYSVEN